MSFLDTLSIVLGAAGLFALILGVFLTYSAQHNGDATRALLRAMQAETRALFERMDQRADDRHREVVEAIGRMRA